MMTEKRRIRQRNTNVLTMASMRLTSIVAFFITAVSTFQNDMQSHRPHHTQSIQQRKQHQNFAYTLLRLEMSTVAEAELQTPTMNTAFQSSMERSLKQVYFPQGEDISETDLSRASDAYLNVKLGGREINTKANAGIEFENNSPSIGAKQFKRISSTSNSQPVRISKSLHYGSVKTMPGFGNSASTGREKAFRDGIRLFEERSGKKYKETPAAKKMRQQKNGHAMYKHSASVPDSMVAFANEIHTIDRITPSEEISLGEKTQEAIRLQNLHDSLEDRLDRPPTESEWCAAAGKINLESLRVALEEGLEAKNKLITTNLRMVQGVVNIYIRNGLGTEYNAGDMMQEGIMALIRAAEKFDPTRGFRFSTYAMYWIRSAVKKSQIYQSRVVTVPVRVYENQKRILRVEKEMSAKLGRKPTKKEIGASIGMSELQVNRCLTAMAQRYSSLDAELINGKKPNNGDNGETLLDIVSSKSDDVEYNKQSRSFLREDLVRTLDSHLTPEEVLILRLRYGMMDKLLPGEKPNLKSFAPLTIAEVGKRVGLKPDKVRRIILRSLKRLKMIIGDEWIDYERQIV